MNIRLSKQAEKFLKKQTKKTQIKVIEMIEKIPNQSHELDIKPYQGNDADYRLKFGKIRVLYDEEGNIIDIIRIGYRGDVYKKK